MNSPRFIPFRYALPKLNPGDVVSTPSGREARFMGEVSGRFSLEYLDDGGEVLLQPSLLRFVRRVDGGQ